MPETLIRYLWFLGGIFLGIIITLIFDWFTSRGKEK